MNWYGKPSLKDKVLWQLGKRSPSKRYELAFYWANERVKKDRQIGKEDHLQIFFDEDQRGYEEAIYRYRFEYILMKIFDGLEEQINDDNSTTT